jgi:hypothetical protein
VAFADVGSALVFVTVRTIAAHERLIDFNDAAKFVKILVSERGADPVAHIPSGRIRAETHIAMDLTRANSFFARQHQVNDAEPLAKVNLRVFEYRSGNVGEAISTAFAAIRAFPMPFAGLKRIDFGALTTRAADALRPTAGDQIGVAGILIREGRLELSDRHLLDLAGLFGAGHVLLPQQEKA